MDVRIVFMGTPEFSVRSLESLAGGPYWVVGVFTQPDRVSGRGQRLSESPVKKAAVARGLPVFQPERLSQPAAFRQIADLKPDLIVVAAFGQLLKQNVLDLPRFGCLNVHPSLLPRYRGASPVAGAILNGDNITGVTIMLMDAGMDTGPIVTQAHVPIHPEDTTGILTERLAGIGALMLLQTIPLWLDGKIKAQPQDDRLASYTKGIAKEDGLLDWKLSARELWLRVRAFNPWPGSYTIWKGKRLRVLQAAPVYGVEAAPGRVIPLNESGPSVVGAGTGNGVLALVRLQLEGKREVPADEFLRGYRDFVGSVLGV